MSRDEITAKIIYLLYDPKDGRIVGQYSHFDARTGASIRCNPEQVKAIVSGASPQLKQGRFEVLEIEPSAAVDIRAVRVEPKTKRLAPRRPQSVKKRGTTP